MFRKNNEFIFVIAYCLLEKSEKIIPTNRYAHT